MLLLSDKLFYSMWISLIYKMVHGCHCAVSAVVERGSILKTAARAERVFQYFIDEDPGSMNFLCCMVIISLAIEI